MNMSVRLHFAEPDIEILWFMDMSWFTDVLMAIG